ncbi:A/G-specific adenine glycosylase [Mucilaginibacter daejeonensis]|uniref:A/G-specific adenine glycosylase n=1 Tax=Mucilaginibacter daejeonensis TaxID=398049 RepID=UPI001D1779CD|nr:A/G-specific adenine glycosylase [Mucilaginibacter daejeonensis]UEG53568.1 A/G-specific adenine glycosylase [Mucilaginibacter daejeonensis]
MNFAHELVQWYHTHKRDLPWRHTHDAYVIWLSEVILQQTRVEQGLPYFNRFLAQYPTVTHFANATEDEVLKLWQGLGYYSRGRNMLKTAQLVQEKYDGVFPTRYDDLIELKGIGEYTAAAIASFSANEAKAVLDGNVFRVLARYFGIAEPINSPKGKKLFQQLANEVLDHQEPGLHNQAMMEFGAMLCKPRNPACGICPVRLGCEAFKTNATTQLPVKLKTVKVKNRCFNYFLIIQEGRILMNKRTGNDIWNGLYDLPLIETDHLMPVPELMRSDGAIQLFGADAQVNEVFAEQKHILTHQRLSIRFIRLQNAPAQLLPDWFYATQQELENLALPKIIFLFLTNFFKFENNSLFSIDHKCLE